MKQWLLLLLFIVSNLPTKAQTIQFNTSPTTIKELMSLVEEQTSYSFAYSNNIQTNRALGAEVLPASMEVKQLLEKLNLQHAYKYEIIGNTITVKQAAQNNAQKNYTLSGTITDPANVPLLGANIYVEEAATGTSTDENGKFALELPAGTYTLNISYIGFMNQTQTVNLNQDITIKAQLEEDGESLEEVV
ncbi:carboxypeptidase-like regulatory domain-containing protein, partial [Mesonia mobilis]|uniref:carboxypeptidase-like regulatory domain-containing protein n=1 Tax=Mesonia mobilis TaxID=369791 RepID=UPI0026EA05F4